MARSYNPRDVMDEDRLRAIKEAHGDPSREIVNALVAAGLKKLQTEPGIVFPCDVEELDEALRDSYNWITEIIEPYSDQLTDDQITAILAEAGDKITDGVGEKTR